MKKNIWDYLRVNNWFYLDWFSLKIMIYFERKKDPIDPLEYVPSLGTGWAVVIKGWKQSS